MAKRRFNPSLEEDKTPVVEKLYRESQPSFFCAGGFMEDDDEAEERREKISDAKQRRLDASVAFMVMPEDCIKCEKALIDSWLWERYNHPVCDTCRDDKDEHKLIARTEAKTMFLLKDEDFDVRKPPLRYYAKKNPHNPRYGDMKLYLKSQVVARMLEVHGSWDQLEEEKVKRAANKEVRAERTFEKKIKEMRQQIRGLSSVRVDKSTAHEHQFGPEEYDEEKDEYKKLCIECGYLMRYEKM